MVLEKYEASKKKYVLVLLLNETNLKGKSVGLNGRLIELVFWYGQWEKKSLEESIFLAKISKIIRNEDYMISICLKLCFCDCSTISHCSTISP